MIQVQCPKCKQYLMASDEQAGTMMACRHCGTWVPVPGGTAEGAEEEAQVPCPFCAERILVRAGDIGIPISCPHCSEMLRVAEDPVTRRLVLLAGDRDLSKEPIPWEDRARLGILKALWNTFKEVAFAPADFFRRLRPLGLGDVIGFVMVINLIVAIAAIIPQLGAKAAFRMVGFPPTPPSPTPGAPGMPFFFTSTQGTLAFELLGMLVGVVLAPLAAVIGLFISSGLAHLALMIVGGARTGFETTCRVFGYSQAAYAFAVIPICGALIGMVWIIVAATVGLREANRISTGKALVAALAPMILGVLCCVIPILAIFGVALFSFAM